MRAAETHEFTISNHDFVLKPLPVSRALKGLSVLTDCLLPALAGISVSLKDVTADKDTIAAVVGATERLDELTELFVQVCKVRVHEKLVPLKTFVDEVFALDTVGLLAWLVECVTFQYADFLSETGREPLVSVGTSLISRLGLTGESGESSPTPE